MVAHGEARQLVPCSGDIRDLPTDVRILETIGAFTSGASVLFGEGAPAGQTFASRTEWPSTLLAGL